MTVNNIKYDVSEVLVLAILHIEKNPVFGQIKYILNTGTMWCSAVTFCFDCPLTDIFIYI